MQSKKPPRQLRKSRTFSMTDAEHQDIKECARIDGRNPTRQVVHLAQERLKQQKRKGNKAP